MIEKVTECRVLKDDPLNCSDHYPVFISLDLDTLAPTTANAKCMPSPRCNKMSESNIKALYTEVVNRQMQDVLTFIGKATSPDDVDEAINMIVQILQKASCVIPISVYRPNLKPYWNENLKRLKDLKVQKDRMWVKDARHRASTSETFKAHKQAKRLFAREIRKTSKEYENKIMVEAIENSSAERSVFWQHLKRCRGATGSKVLAIKNKHDKVVYEISDILSVWQDHFSTLSTPSYDETCDK